MSAISYSELAYKYPSKPPAWKLVKCAMNWLLYDASLLRFFSIDKKKIKDAKKKMTKAQQMFTITNLPWKLRKLVIKKKSTTLEVAHAGFDFVNLVLGMLKLSGSIPSAYQQNINRLRFLCGMISKVITLYKEVTKSCNQNNIALEKKKWFVIANIANGLVLKLIKQMGFKKSWLAMLGMTINAAFANVKYFAQSASKKNTKAS